MPTQLMQHEIYCITIQQDQPIEMVIKRFILLLVLLILRLYVIDSKLNSLEIRKLNTN